MKVTRTMHDRKGQTPGMQVGPNLFEHTQRSILQYFLFNETTNPEIAA